ncbi:hypothetical protein TNCT_365751 [Trichonephila clavata]|uniref:Uncharacterized protein n=1 Tax=Trichonephila clavata TaxID=2740835 RepID=A0A8X6GWU3_TRICU|nr:hypothetical protein TNCT_365751 [Trichonephila clavata]
MSVLNTRVMHMQTSKDSCLNIESSSYHSLDLLTCPLHHNDEVEQNNPELLKEDNSLAASPQYNLCSMPPTENYVLTELI